MNVGSWIKQNKVAAVGAAAVGGFIFLSRRGASAATDTTGQLVPVAAGYPNEDTAPYEQAAEAATAASEAAGQATQAAQDLVQSVTPADTLDPVVVAPTATTVPPSPAFAATPAPSSLTPTPTPQPVQPQKYSLPGGYTPGTVLGYGAGSPPNLHMLIGNVLGWKKVGAGSNSNGGYDTFRFYSDIGATGDWNFYNAGPKKMTWVGPFNLGQRPGG